MPLLSVLMRRVAGTYGKTWHTWQTDKDNLPVGRPALMMAFTRDGQARADLTARRDREFAVSTQELRRRRADLSAPAAVAGVDQGEDGRSCRPASADIKKVRGKEK